MKKVAFLTALLVVLFGLGGIAWAYEGGTKAVVTMTHPEKEGRDFRPILLISHDHLLGTKPVVEFLHRIPQPTFSHERIREEKMSASWGTKPAVRFQRSW